VAQELVIRANFGVAIGLGGAPAPVREQDLVRAGYSVMGRHRLDCLVPPLWGLLPASLSSPYLVFGIHCVSCGHYVGVLQPSLSLAIGSHVDVIQFFGPWTLLARTFSKESVAEIFLWVVVLEGGQGARMYRTRFSRHKFLLSRPGH
jgi:hypothetical protein